MADLASHLYAAYVDSPTPIPLEQLPKREQEAWARVAVKAEACVAQRSVPCGRCDACAKQAAADNAARDQPPAFTGTVEQLAAHINALDAVDRIRLGAATRTLTPPHRITCATCGKLIRGGHERDSSNHCWGHEDEDEVTP